MQFNYECMYKTATEVIKEHIGLKMEKNKECIMFTFVWKNPIRVAIFVVKNNINLLPTPDTTKYEIEGAFRLPLLS